MDPAAAKTDLEFVTDLVRRTSQRIDSHSYHCVHWGLIVLVWFPLANWVGNAGHWGWYAGIGIASVTLGAALSGFRSASQARSPRLPGGNTFVSTQIAWICGANIAAGGILSFVVPATGLMHGANVPILWGLVYANMAFMIGVAYSREFVVAGCVIFAATLLAIVFQDYNGYILGPAMGFGMIIPGVRAEARVRRLVAEGDGVEPTA